MCRRRAPRPPKKKLLFHVLPRRVLPFTTDRHTMDRVYQAKLAEQAERYREMADFMRGVCQDKKDELTVSLFFA